MSTKKELKIQLRKEKFERRKQYAFVIRELTSREIKRRYARSYLGILWSVLSPLLYMAVMSLIFSKMFSRSIDKFPLYYLTGNIFYSLFTTATNSAMTALVDNKMLLIKAKLPKQTFVLSRMYTALVNFGYTCIAYALMLIVFRAQISLKSLLFIPDVALMMALSMGVGYILSIVYVFFADIHYLYNIFTTLLMYLSAVFYPLESLSENLQAVIRMNPVYLSIYIARECVVYGRLPELSAWIILSVEALAIFSLGYLVFRKNQNKVMAKV